VVKGSGGIVGEGRISGLGPRLRVAVASLWCVKTMDSTRFVARCFRLIEGEWGWEGP